jgi:hypothetical protein
VRDAKIDFLQLGDCATLFRQKGQKKGPNAPAAARHCTRLSGRRPPDSARFQFKKIGFALRLRMEFRNIACKNVGSVPSQLEKARVRFVCL